MLVEEIETLRGQMQDMTAREEALLQGLAESLHAAEQRLLTHVRDIAARHSERRMQLIDELRGLAAGLGSMNPASQDDTTAPVIAQPMLPQVTYGAVASMPTSGGGHWRDATRMISDDEGGLDIARLLRANAR